jgi:hypothetical protein
MKRQSIVILLVLFACLKMQAQTSSATPADTTMHVSLNSYAHPVSFAPATTPQQQEYRHYLKTAKTLKIAGWSALGVGIPIMVYGLGMAIGSVEDSRVSHKAANLVFASGAALTLSSIPLFIVSHHYKKKAVSVSLGSQQVFIPRGNGFVSSVQPALSIKVSLLQ